MAKDRSLTAQLLHPFSLMHLFIVATLYLHVAYPDAHTAIFLCACFAIVPLAGWMGKATEHIAEKTGEGVGGLLNATFGNAAEIILALFALQKGLYDVVKASLTGSIIGNVLLVMGLSCFAGGVRHRVQRFNATAARVQSTMLTLAAASLIVPAAYHHLYGEHARLNEAKMSLVLASVLLITYVASLLFSLRTHRKLFVGTAAEAAHLDEDAHRWTMGRSFAVLTVSAVFVGWISEILVGSVEHAAQAFGMGTVFIGVVVVAIAGNAAEHSTAILVALKNRMDLSIGIAVGSSVQIALFAAPVLVFASYFVGPHPMDLVFTQFEVLAVALAVWVAGQVAEDGESNWLEGLQLLALYFMLAIGFYFLPA